MECSHGFVVISKVHCCFHSTSKSTARHSIGNVFWDTLGHGPWHDTPYIKLGTTLNMIFSVTNSNSLLQY